MLKQYRIVMDDGKEYRVVAEDFRLKDGALMFERNGLNIKIFNFSKVVYFGREKELPEEKSA